MQPYTAPKFSGTAFNCPFCSAYAAQIWVVPVIEPNTVVAGMPWPPNRNLLTYSRYEEVVLSVCTHCVQTAIWRAGTLVYPDFPAVAPPNPDLADEIQADYREAASIVQRSPRGAAALLRLCVQKLCAQLGESGDNINRDIASLVTKGLPVTIQQALDILRVTGNNAAHPGEMDLQDDTSTATSLFNLVNLIADNRISEPKRIEAMYAALPEAQREAINKRDNGRPAEKSSQQ